MDAVQPWRGLRKLQRFEEAIAWYQQAIAVSREIGERYEEGEALNGLGDAYHQLRQPDRAAE